MQIDRAELPPFVQSVAVGIVFVAGLFLVVLALVALVRPDLGRRFLLGFAETATAHYAEMTTRILVGLALIIASPRMSYAQVFFWFGVVLVGSSLVLLCLPWTWHRAFARRVLPGFVRMLWIVSPVSLVLGAALVAATLDGGG